MTIYETIKAAISVKQAAEHYGLKAGRNGMACCPFHNDRHPSLKLNEEYFFCFGCGAKGDVIDFVASPAPDQLCKIHRDRTRQDGLGTQRQAELSGMDSY